MQTSFLGHLVRMPKNRLARQAGPPRRLPYSGHPGARTPLVVDAQARTVPRHLVAAGAADGRAVLWFQGRGLRTLRWTTRGSLPWPRAAILAGRTNEAAGRGALGPVGSGGIGPHTPEDHDAETTDARGQSMR
ncbi:unnamed protein product, partial [Amoebophrya sp. A120]|eukprot:GSA120T00002908001.1